MYNILVIHGVPVFGLMLYLMFTTWARNRKGISGRKVACCALAAVFSVCFESFFDVDLIWTNYSINMLFLVLALNSDFQSGKSGYYGQE